jgi:hypothetical protein
VNDAKNNIIHLKIANSLRSNTQFFTMYNLVFFTLFTNVRE